MSHPVIKTVHRIAMAIFEIYNYGNKNHYENILFLNSCIQS